LINLGQQYGQYVSLDHPTCGTLILKSRSQKGQSMARKILLGCGVVSSVLYVVTDVLGTLRHPGYRCTEQQFSELTAAGSPVRSLMIALNEVPYNLLVAAFAGGVWKSATPKRAAHITGAMLLGYAVSGMVTGVFFPMKTREALAAGEGELRNAMHPVGTAVMSLFMVLAIGLLRAQDDPGGGRDSG
jgi:hypothetical protein